MYGYVDFARANPLWVNVRHLSQRAASGRRDGLLIGPGGELAIGIEVPDGMRAGLRVTIASRDAGESLRYTANGRAVDGSHRVNEHGLAVDIDAGRLVAGENSFTLHNPSDVDVVVPWILVDRADRPDAAIGARQADRESEEWEHRHSRTARRFFRYATTVDDGDKARAGTLLLHLDTWDGPQAAEVSWRTADGTSASIHRTADLASFTGTYQRADGTPSRYTGVLAGEDRIPRTATLPEKATAFRTERSSFEWMFHTVVSIEVDDGSHSPLTQLSWRDLDGERTSMALSPDGASFTGHWLPDGDQGPHDYRGVRITGPRSLPVVTSPDPLAFTGALLGPPPDGFRDVAAGDLAVHDGWVHFDDPSAPYSWPSEAKPGRYPLVLRLDETREDGPVVRRAVVIVDPAAPLSTADFQEEPVRNTGLCDVVEAGAIFDVPLGVRGWLLEHAASELLHRGRDEGAGNLLAKMGEVVRPYDGSFAEGWARTAPDAYHGVEAVAFLVAPEAPASFVDVKRHDGGLAAVVASYG